MCVCVCECVCLLMCVWVSEWECVCLLMCVCMCVSEKQQNEISTTKSSRVSECVYVHVWLCVCVCVHVWLCVCMWVCTTQKEKKRERDRKKGGKRIGSREIYQMHFLFIYWPWILTLKAIGLWLQSSAWSVGREEGSSSWRWSLKGWRLSLNFFPDPKNGTQIRCWKYGWAWTHNYTLSSSWPSLVLPHSRSLARICVRTYTHILTHSHIHSLTQKVYGLSLSLFLSHTLSCGQELYQAYWVPIAL